MNGGSLGGLIYFVMWPIVGSYTVYLWPLKAYTIQRRPGVARVTTCAGVRARDRTGGDGGGGATTVGENAHWGKAGEGNAGEGRGEGDDGEGDGVRTRAARETATQGGMAAGAAAAKHAAVDKTAAATAETAAAQRWVSSPIAPATMGQKGGEYVSTRTHPLAP